MSAEENKATIRRLVEEVNRRGLAAFQEALAPSYVSHNASSIPGLQDVQRTAQDVMAEGDKVTLRFTGRAVHAPTGKQVIWEAIHIYRMAEGKIVESWGIMDHWGVLEQLGMAPAMPTDAEQATG